jgi:hypothetical protein
MRGLSTTMGCTVTAARNRMATLIDITGAQKAGEVNGL